MGLVGYCKRQLTMIAQLGPMAYWYGEAERTGRSVEAVAEADAEWLAHSIVDVVRANAWLADLVPLLVFAGLIAYIDHKIDVDRLSRLWRRTSATDKGFFALVVGTAVLVRIKGIPGVWTPPPLGVR